MKTKRRKQRTTNTPLNIVTTKQHTRHYTWGKAPVSTWTRQPSGVVRGGGWVTALIHSSSSLRMQQSEEEAREILAAAYKNQAENGPNTRRAAIRACKYLKVLVERHGKIIHQVHMAAQEHRQQSKGIPHSRSIVLSLESALA